MDAYIVNPEVLTCLGSGNEFWENLLEGKSGLSAAKDVFTDWFPESNSQIGSIKSLALDGSRLNQIMHGITEVAFSENVNKCELILGASSLGDLDGEFAGDPYGCMTAFFNSNFPELASRFKGVISSACSSGTDVLSLASILVDQGKYDIIGVIAADCLDPGKLMQHFALGTQAENRAMPFDVNRVGTSFGEGGGFSIVANKKGLEKLDINEAYNLRGFGLSCDAMYITAPDETGENPSLAISRALTAANCDAEQVAYINAHASGTPLNDQVESIAYRKVFNSALDDTAISGTKGAIGHLLGGTGLVEAIVACWALKHAVAPGTAGLSELDESLNVAALMQGQTRKLSQPLAISSTFGFGGVNSAVVVEKMH